MPQEIRVLQCFECLMHQVDIVKKAKKWQCKVCGAKQSLRKECYRGSGAECRAMVQQLNMEEHEKKQKDHNETLNLLANDDDFDWETIEKSEHEVLMYQTSTTTGSTQGIKESKWSAYDTKNGETQVDNDGEERKLVTTKYAEVREQDAINRNSSNKQENKWATFDQKYNSNVQNHLESLDALDTDFDWEAVEQFERQALARETQAAISSQTQSILLSTGADGKNNEETQEENALETLNILDANINCCVIANIEKKVMRHESASIFSSRTESKLSAPAVNSKNVPNAENDNENEHQSNILNFGNKQKWSRSQSTTSENVKRQKTNEASSRNKSKKHSKWDQFM